MVRFLVALFITLQFSWLFASLEEAVVIEVRKKIKLHDTERTYADYFIKGGSKLGLSEGVLISVIRRVPVHDPFDNASVGDFRVKVADIEIIQSDSEKSIGRLVEIDRRQARFMLAYDAIMIGDRLDLNSMRSKVSFREAPSSVFDRSRMPASEPQLESLPQEDLGQEPIESNKENNTPTLTKP